MGRSVIRLVGEQSQNADLAHYFNAREIGPTLDSANLSHGATPKVPGDFATEEKARGVRIISEKNHRSQVHDAK
jgi:hypothetical protein